MEYQVKLPRVQVVLPPDKSLAVIAYENGGRSVDAVWGENREICEQHLRESPNHLGITSLPIVLPEANCIEATGKPDERLTVTVKTFKEDLLCPFCDEPMEKIEETLPCGKKTWKANHCLWDQGRDADGSLRRNQDHLINNMWGGEYHTHPWRKQDIPVAAHHLLSISGASLEESRDSFLFVTTQAPFVSPFRGLSQRHGDTEGEE